MKWPEHISAPIPSQRRLGGRLGGSYAFYALRASDGGIENTRRLPSASRRSGFGLRSRPMPFGHRTNHARSGLRRVFDSRHPTPGNVDSLVSAGLLPLSLDKIVPHGRGGRGAGGRAEWGAGMDRRPLGRRPRHEARAGFRAGETGVPTALSPLAIFPGSAGAGWRQDPRPRAGVPTALSPRAPSPEPPCWPAPSAPEQKFAKVLRAASSNGMESEK